MSSLFFQSSFIILINDKKTNVQQEEKRKYKRSIVSDTHTNTHRHTNKDYHQET